MVESSRGRVWAIVLAGGEGERLRPLTERRLGRHVPKQYCAFVGTRSMLEHTLDRAAHVAAVERIVTVVGRDHRRYLRGHPALARGTLVEQPLNRDTAAGAFLGLSFVLAADPGASVVIFPSDHFVHPEATFVATVEQALRAADLLDQLVVLGVKPQSAETEYGWIVPGHRIAAARTATSTYTVKAFHEKPDAELAANLRRAGAFWNTMVVAGPATLVWALGQRVLPEVVGRLEPLRAAVHVRSEDVLLAAAYETMPTRNFSRDYLQRITDRLAVMELAGVTWSDWGNPGRITEGIEWLGRRPAFVATHDRPRVSGPLVADESAGRGEDHGAAGAPQAITVP